MRQKVGATGCGMLGAAGCGAAGGATSGNAGAVGAVGAVGSATCGALGALGSPAAVGVGYTENEPLALSVKMSFPSAKCCSSCVGQAAPSPSPQARFQYSMALGRFTSTFSPRQ